MITNGEFNVSHKTVLMMGHKICFNGELWIIIRKLSLVPLLIWSTDIHQSVLVCNISDQSQLTSVIAYISVSHAINGQHEIK